MSPLRFVLPLFVVAVLGPAGLPGDAAASHQPATFSIVAYDSVTGELGVAVESKYFSVGLVVPWARAGAGAVATQSNVNPSFGPMALDLMEAGMSPDEVMKSFAANDSLWDSRQFALVDARGRAATWTGSKCNTWAGGELGVHFACQGNILTGPEVVASMARAYRESHEELAGRLIAALEAGQKAGGDRRGQQSAAVIVVRPSRTHPEFRHKYVDLRVEDHKTPIAELRRLWRIHQGFHGTGSHMAMAAEYEADGRPDLAGAEREAVHQTLLQVLARGERDASLLNGLAWSCAVNGAHLGDALKAAERAAMLQPRSGDILDTLAEVHYRMGNAAKAIEIEKRALALDPKNPYLKGQIERFEGGAR